MLPPKTRKESAAAFKGDLFHWPPFFSDSGGWSAESESHMFLESYQVIPRERSPTQYQSPITTRIIAVLAGNPSKKPWLGPALAGRCRLPNCDKRIILVDMVGQGVKGPRCFHFNPTLGLAKHLLNYHAGFFHGVLTHLRGCTRTVRFS